MARAARTEIRGNGWTRRKTIDARKFELVSTAILESLTSEPIAFGTLAALVARRLPDFDGSVPWYAISCARELEMRGQIVRREKPVRYLKAGDAR